MISLKAGIAVSIAALIVFGGVAYFTLAAPPPSLSLSSTGYFSVDNHTADAYFITNTTTSLDINFTAYSNVIPISMYVYDISPVNNTSAVWTNITTLDGTANYMQITMTTNGTLEQLNLSINQAAVSQMALSDPATGILHPYVVEIIIISANDNSAGFGFALFRV